MHNPKILSYKIRLFRYTIDPDRPPDRYRIVRDIDNSLVFSYPTMKLSTAESIPVDVYVLILDHPSKRPIPKSPACPKSQNGDPCSVYVISSQRVQYNFTL